MFIDEECWYLKVVVDIGELTRNITKKKKPDVLQAYKCPLCESTMSTLQVRVFFPQACEIF